MSQKTRRPSPTYHQLHRYNLQSVRYGFTVCHRDGKRRIRDNQPVQRIDRVHRHGYLLTHLRHRLT